MAVTRRLLGVDQGSGQGEAGQAGWPRQQALIFDAEAAEVKSLQPSIPSEQVRRVGLVSQSGETS